MVARPTTILGENKMEKEKSIEVKCEECQDEFEFNNLEVIEKPNVKIDDDTFTVIYYKCPTCGTVHIVGMLNYRANRIKNAYFSACDSVSKFSQGHKLPKAIMDQKLQRMNELKQENIELQKQLISLYGHRIPQSVFED